MVSATKLMMTNEPVFTVDETKHKYGTRVDWLDCDADTFINYWLPKFDRQECEQPRDETQGDEKSETPKHAKRPIQESTEKIKDVLRVEPMTLSEIARAIGTDRVSTVHKVVVGNPLFRVVAEKRVGKNPSVKVWGLA